MGKIFSLKSVPNPRSGETLKQVYVQQVGPIFCILIQHVKREIRRLEGYLKRTKIGKCLVALHCFRMSTLKSHFLKFRFRAALRFGKFQL